MSVHSAPNSRLKKVRSKKWDTVPIPTIDDLEAMTEADIRSTPLPSGFCVRFLCHDMNHLFTVASNQVRITRGALDYLHDYNQLGPNKSRSKLFICSQYNKTKTCINGSLCREVHCVLNVEDAQDALQHQVPSNATGAPNTVTLAPSEDIIAKRLNEPFAVSTTVPAFSTVGDSNPLDSILGSGCAAAEGPACIYMPEKLILRHSLHTRWTSASTYPTLPSGVEFRVALPNTPNPVDVYDSSALFVTRGAQEYFMLCMRNEQPTVTMQHCAHYSKNGICCFGEDCQFVHVVHYKPRDRAENSISDPDAGSMGSSITTSESSRRRSVRHVSAPTRQTPLETHVPGKKLESLISSRSPSSNHDAYTPHQKAIQVQNNSGLSTPGNHVFVPSSSTAASRAPPALPPHFAQDQIMIPTMQPQTSPLMSQSYMVMQGINGQCYIVPQPPHSMPPAGQSAPNQPVYVMPMTFH
ncbi:hypothetical protein, conserved [Leishmania tarentolae]|uniref:C3H1-type domain-containing protein n=1 Tax=Leishmania tarentolae TaxID=5689 RepID=A0A640KG06_LEITA|nr:hypothetical protein, conserved [Leishmania tarentolae]